MFKKPRMGCKYVTHKITFYKKSQLVITVYL
jgi:hypothetical protein